MCNLQEKNGMKADSRNETEDQADPYEPRIQDLTILVIFMWREEGQNSRAVHMEVAKSLETDAFILLLMRFLNQRGHVNIGSNFVGADREIKEAIERIDHDREKVRRELFKRGCK